MTENQIEVAAALCAMSNFAVEFKINSTGEVSTESGGRTLQLKPATTYRNIESLFWSTQMGGDLEVPEGALREETDSWVKTMTNEPQEKTIKYFPELSDVLKFVA